MTTELNARYDPMTRDELIAECERLRADLALLKIACHIEASKAVTAIANDALDAAARCADEPKAPLTYAGACNLLVNYAIALQDRQCCGDEMQPQYLAALKACTDAMGVQPENRKAE